MTTVTITPSVVNISISQGVTQLNAMTKTSLTGSDFSGVAGVDRSYTHTEGISVNAIISVGGRFLLPGEYSLSTVTAGNDTITVHLFLEDDDVVLIWD
jgi:hypothetical protein